MHPYLVALEDAVAGLVVEALDFKVVELAVLFTVATHKQQQ